MPSNLTKLNRPVLDLFLAVMLAAIPPSSTSRGNP